MSADYLQRKQHFKQFECHLLCTYPLLLGTSREIIADGSYIYPHIRVISLLL